MNLQSRIGRLEKTRPDRREVCIWQNHDETTDQALARWRERNPEQDVEDKAVTFISWHRPQ